MLARLRVATPFSALQRAAFSSLPEASNSSLSSLAWIEVDGCGERGTIAISDEHQHSLRVDQPVSEGGHGEGAGPLTHLLGAVIAASHASLQKAASRQHIVLGKVRWGLSASADESALSGSAEGLALGGARLRQLLLRAEVETDGTYKVVESLQEAVGKSSCVVMDTIRAAGVDVTIHFRKKHDFKSSMGTHLP